MVIEIVTVGFRPLRDLLLLHMTGHVLT